MDQLWSETCGAITIVHFEADYTSLAPEQLAGIRECLFGLTAFVQVPWLLFDLGNTEFFGSAFVNLLVACHQHVHSR